VAVLHAAGAASFATGLLTLTPKSLRAHCCQPPRLDHSSGLSPPPPVLHFQSTPLFVGLLRSSPPPHPPRRQRSAPPRAQCPRLPRCARRARAGARRRGARSPPRTHRTRHSQSCEPAVRIGQDIHSTHRTRHSQSCAPARRRAAQPPGVIRCTLPTRCAAAGAGRGARGAHAVEQPVDGEASI